MTEPLNDRIRSIYYLIPDIHKRDFSLIKLARALRRGRAVRHIRENWFRKHKPVGGIKVMYQHCMLLQSLGYNARPLLMGRYEGNFFGFPIRGTKLEEVGFDLSEHDVVVCSEVFPYQAMAFKRAKKVLFAQNFAQLYRSFRPQDVEKSYTDLGYHYVLYCGEFIRQKLYRETDEHVFLINNFIDHQRFKPDPDIRVKRRVLGLPRKNPHDLNEIINLVNHKNIEFRLVDGLSETEIIKEYQAADVFLATGYPEGFGLPPIEAMACGAAVVGFTGGGASEFMKDRETALVAADGDVRAAAAALNEIMENAELRESIRTAGQKVSQIYTLERTRDQLAEFFGRHF